MKIERIISRAREELANKHPDLFEALIKKYREAIISCVIEDCEIDEDIKSISNGMVECNAKASDILKLHTETMSLIVKESSPFDAKLYLEEGNIRLLQLLSCSVDCYRKRLSLKK